MDRSARVAPSDAPEDIGFKAQLGTIQHLLRGNLNGAPPPALLSGENVIPFSPAADETAGSTQDSWVDTLTAITHVADTVRATEEQAAQLEARTEKLVGIALEQLSKAETRIVNVELRLEESQTALRGAESRCADLESRLRDAETRAAHSVTRFEEAEDRARRAEALQRTTEVRAIDAECALELAQERVRVADGRCHEAEQWRERIHDAVATHFPAAMAQWQSSAVRGRTAKARAAAS